VAEEVKRNGHEIEEEGFTTVIAFEIDLPFAPAQPQGVYSVEEFVAVDAWGNAL
jgi:hypothetical protein